MQCKLVRRRQPRVKYALVPWVANSAFAYHEVSGATMFGCIDDLPCPSCGQQQYDDTKSGNCSVVGTMAAEMRHTLR